MVQSVAFKSTSSLGVRGFRADIKPHVGPNKCRTQVRPEGRQRHIVMASPVNAQLKDCDMHASFSEQIKTRVLQRPVPVQSQAKGSSVHTFPWASERELQEVLI